MKRYISILVVLAFVAGLSIVNAQTPESPSPPPPAPPERDKVIVDPNTERILQGALKYLAGQQSPAGSWSVRGDHPIAMTGYTIMAFLACGHLPGEGEHGKTVTNGVNYLLGSVREDGYITSDTVRGGRKPSNMYDHGVATIALAEVYGQTHDPNIKAKLELAVKLIRNSQAKNGGWRYAPRPADADISVTVLQVVALRAAKNAGIVVPDDTIQQAVKYVKECYHKQSGGFGYQPHNGPGFARTAAAIYSLQVCGLYDDEMVKTGSKFLIDIASKRGSDRHYYTYGLFYAAPAQYMIGGDTWTKWYANMRDTLVPIAVSQGDIAYWPKTAEGDAQGQGLVPIYTTAVYVSILAMPYHYVPLYQR